MLTLSRKPQQSIHIGDDITITVHEVVGSKVYLTIEAPRDVPVYRDEIYAKIVAGIAPDAKP